MFDLLWTIPVFPLASFLVLAIWGGRLRRGQVALLGAGSVGLSALVSAAIAVRFLTSPPAGDSFTQTLWTWMGVEGFRPAIAFYLDPLSVVMLLVVTGVGFFIHLYATEYMEEDEGYSRFFAYMNLFVGSMVILVLADNLVLLYLGWEGVGLCSYLLIGYWYKDAANGRAARKAFIVTRVGDTAMALGLFLLYERLGTLDIQLVLGRAEASWPVGSTLAVVAALLLLGGAVGKSAQLPLQTWLPDAMAGPTPVSALIHAATMVTAGVYLIARTHTLYELAPGVLLVVAVVGAATLLLSGFSALCQVEIKRVLAYSTISQIGYMFLGLGVGAWAFAIFHLVTHAFFKALLFLGAGVVSHALHGEHDIRKMGGLRKALPVPYFMFLVGGAALAGFPLVTAGFYSKDAILWVAWAGEHGSRWLWSAGLLGALVTAVYTFRLIFLVFFGEAKTPVGHGPGRRIMIALGVLTVLSIVGGFIDLPPTLGDLPLFSHFVERALPAAELHYHDGGAPAGHGTELLLQVVAGLTSILGIFLAWLWFVRRPAGAAGEVPGVGPGLARYWLGGWGFDTLYDTLFVRPFVYLARVNKDDFFDLIYRFLAALAAAGHRTVRPTQNGRLRWYAAALALGTVVVIALMVLP